MQQKMNAKQTLKSEQTRRSSSSNINRRQIRRANTHPYIRNKINSENCYRCDQNQDYINNLSARFTKIENLVENLSKAVKSTTLTRKIVSPTSIAFGSVDLTKMSINELLNFSSQLGIHLFNKFDKEKKNPSSPSSPTTTTSTTTRNDDKENKILKNIEKANANSNDFQNVH